MKTIDEIIDGYFEATLSEEEETALKAFLASPEGQAPEYDEVRAVMGYFATGRSVEILRSRPLSQNDKIHAPVILSETKDLRHRSPLWRRVAAIAASLTIIVTLGVSLYNKNNVCVTFVDGRKVTDKEVVMNDVDNILADLLTDRTDMEELLNDFFDK